MTETRDMVQLFQSQLNMLAGINAVANQRQGSAVTADASGTGQYATRPRSVVTEQTFTRIQDEVGRARGSTIQGHQRSSTGIPGCRDQPTSVPQPRFRHASSMIPIGTTVRNAMADASSRACEHAPSNPSIADATLSAMPGLTATPSNMHRTPSRWLFSDENSYRTSAEPPGSNTIGQAPFRLTPDQIQARKVVQRELPTFNGNPEDWPRYISNYEMSTEMCGFGHHENLTCLEKSLKGEAYSAVEGLLMVPATVPDAIETLRALYGNPEAILDQMEDRLAALPKVNNDRIETLISFSLTVQNHCFKVSGMGMEGSLANDKLVRLLAEKLPVPYRLDWSRASTGRPGNLAEFSAWLFGLGRHAMRMYRPKAVQPTTSRPIYEQERKAVRTTKERPLMHVSEAIPSRHDCAFCKRPDHDIRDCFDYQKLSREGRWEFLKKRGLCQRCFGRHLPRQCRKHQKCGIDGCRLFHHPLLHYVPGTTKTVEARPPKDSDPQAPRETVQPQIHCHAQEEVITLFRILPVTLHGATTTVDTFAFVDEGSSITLIEDGLADELQLDGPSQEICLGWTGDISRSEPNSRKISVNISEHPASRQYRLKNARTVINLNLPMQSVATTTIDAYRHLSGLPIRRYNMGKPRLLIGLDNYRVCSPLELREGQRGEPVAARTRLGWTIYGQIGTCRTSASLQAFHICSNQLDAELHALVNDSFTLDNFGVTKDVAPLESLEGRRSREIMDRTTRRFGRRYETGLLWRFDDVQLPNSLPMARRRLDCLEAKMSRNPDLSALIIKRIAEYVEKGYARKLAPHELTHGPRTWYLPMFTVTNPAKQKVRLVWDAAATVDDVSLNSFLMKGPDQLKSLPGILLRFRERPVAICGDIKEMFHQVRIVKEDQVAQRFLWRDGDRSREPDVYVMEVMTFGASCSPSLAQHVKNFNARTFEAHYPRAVYAITECHYVDDWLDSVATEGEMINLVREVKNIHLNGGFEIRNFVSNSKRVLHAIGRATLSSPKDLSSIETANEKVLGLWWCPDSDYFTFGVKFDHVGIQIVNGEKVPTKREVLRVVMTIFDPLGFLAFFLVCGKIILQEIWRAGIGWDDTIPPEQNEKWVAWSRRLKLLGNVRIPRCYPQAPRDEDLQLHIFVDASMAAFAAVGYIRVGSGEGFTCCLIAAKTKVAPTKPVSIPRLELLAAVLGARLAKFIEREHVIRFKRPPQLDLLFVALRIAELLDLTEIDEWRWVPTSENVADDATKWTRSPELDPDCRWFNGPPFLKLGEDGWPYDPRATENPNTTELVCVTTERRTKFVGLTPDPVRCFSWARLRGAQAFVQRYISNLKAKCARKTPLQGPLTSTELAVAESYLYRTCQMESFGEEMTILQQNPPGVIARSSVVHRYAPYLDELGVMRMYDRIDVIEGVAVEIKRPVILAHEHWITRRIVQRFHNLYLHQNYETVVNEIRQRYVIPRLRSMVDKVRRSCQYCKNLRATAIQPQMGNLPQSRLTPFTRPFTYVGLDYFGPIEVVVGRRVEKRWCALFTCMTTRAVHVEIAHSLSTDSCLMCVRTFISRRGTPLEIISDHGTNFRGASRVLTEELLRVDRQKMKTTLPHIKWTFIPPASPHMGGAWERLVRSMKSGIMAVLPIARRPNDEVFRTALAEIENVVNSRPLTHVPLDSADEEALTPNHFLLGSSNGMRSSGELSADGMVLNRNWRIAQQIADSFWRRWLRDYLPCLTRRAKWVGVPAKQLEVGDVILLVDDKSPRNTWTRGRIVDVNRGKDGQVRSAVVQTTDGIYTRPAVKLAVLDVAAHQDVNGAAAGRRW